MRWLRVSIFVFLVWVQSVWAETDVYFFYAQGCHHCENAQRALGPFFKKHPEVKVHKLEVRNNRTNGQKLVQMGQRYGKKINGVPTIFVGDEVFVGFSSNTGRRIKAKILDCEKNGCKSPL